jgi:hypothetical protein
MSNDLKVPLFVIGVILFFAAMFKLLRRFQRQDKQKRREYFEGLAEHFGGQYFHADIYAHVLAELDGRIFNVGLAQRPELGKYNVTFEIIVGVYGDIPPDLRAFKKVRGYSDFGPYVEVEHGNQELQYGYNVVAKDVPRAKRYLTPERVEAIYQLLTQADTYLWGNALIFSRLHHVSIKRKPKWIEKRIRAIVPFARVLDTEEQPADREWFKERFSRREWLYPEDD